MRQSFFSDSALAHTGIGDIHGFQADFWHPIGGANYLLAVIAVAILAVQMGGKSIWIMPTAFVTLMTLGGILALTGIHLPYIEKGILTSVLVLGILKACQ